MGDSSHDARKVTVEGRMFDGEVDPEYQYRKIYLALLLYVREMTELLYERGGSELALEGIQRGVVKATGDYVVTMPESRPAGDSRCVFKITAV